MVRRTKEEAQATRNHILDTAELVFQAHGVSRTSLHEIAQAAGVTRGAIYWHFEDKADLFNAMMQRVKLPLEEAAKRIGNPASDDPTHEVRELFRQAMRQTVENPQMRRVFEIAKHKVEYVGELQSLGDRHLESRDGFLRLVQRGISLAMRRGQLERRMPARTAALGLHALVDGLISNWVLNPEAFDLVKVGEQAVENFLAGMTIAPAAKAAGKPRRRQRTEL